MRIRYAVLLAVLASLPAFSQQAPKPAGAASPAAQAPAKPAAESKPGEAAKAPTQADAYYHYMLGHSYEETRQYSKAIDEYKLAIAADPTSDFLAAQLVELYTNTGRIKDAVLETQEILKRDPNNVAAHKQLGRIYLRSLGDTQSGQQSESLLHLAIEQYEQIVRLEPSSDNHLMLGRLYRLNNDMVRAESEFKVAVQMQPASEEAVSNLALLYNEENDYARAVQTLTAVPEEARSAKIYATLGYTYEQQKDYKRAVEAYRKAVDLDHDNLDSLRGLAQNLLNDGQMDAALEQYKVVADADSQDAQTYLRLAEIYRRMGQFDAALDNLKKVESLVPGSLEVPYNTALVYDAQGRFQEAAQKLQALLDQTAKSDASYSAADRANRAIFLERLGNIYHEMSQDQQAVDTYRKMLELGDDNASRAFQEIVELYRDDKQYDQALAAAKEASAKLPQDRTLKMVLAAQLADAGQEDAALAQVKSLLKGSPDDHDVYITLTQMYSRMKRWNEAEDALRQADKFIARAEDRDSDNFLWGALYERQKKFDLAEEMFKKVIAADPRNAAALNYLGYMLADRGLRLDEAVGYAQKAVRLEPENGAYLDSLGWAYFKLGNYDMAEQNLRKAGERMGNDGTIQDHLAELYEKKGNLKEAAVHWERALEEWGKAAPADVDSTDVARVQKKLESTKMKLAQQNPNQK
jgi:tetratricopeptide (TPR) repeat protein